MPRRVERTRNDGQWTEARFNQFIRGGLRTATKRWGPRNKCKTEARVGRNLYLCAGYQRKPHKVQGTTEAPKGKTGRVPNVFVDHINPVVDPEKGFVSWDQFIERLFCEKEGFQLLCRKCHDKKTNNEKKLRR